jgi:hypothetical protein
MYNAESMHPMQLFPHALKDSKKIRQSCFSEYAIITLIIRSSPSKKRWNGRLEAAIREELNWES